MTNFGMPNRIQTPNSRPRRAVVLALGAGADAILSTLTDHQHTSIIASNANRDAQFGAIADADLVFLIAAANDDLANAKTLGAHAHARGALVTGILITSTIADEGQLKTLRAGADMLVVASDAEYVSAMLSSLGC